MPKFPDQRPVLNNPVAAVAVAAGAFWIIAIGERLGGWIEWSWWIVMSPPLASAVVVLLVLIVGLASHVFYRLVAWRRRWQAWREKARAEKERRRIRQFFERGLHIVDRRDHVPPARPWTRR